jgi:hypothetical protein
VNSICPFEDYVAVGIDKQSFKNQQERAGGIEFSGRALP